MPKPRARPEFDGVAVPIKREMENAGFTARFMGKKFYLRNPNGYGGRWISAVPKGTPDWYYHHAERKLSVWVETKASGEQLTPEQAAFLADHAGSETQAVCWDDVALCRLWLIHEGLLQMVGGIAHYPDGIHNIRWSQFPVTEEEWSS